MLYSTPVYYNEHNPYCVQWLKNSIHAGLLPYGDVDSRGIEEVTSTDLRGYSQCHFFTGIGIWPYALKLTGVPPDENIWTGSAPCQPFSSAANKRIGVNDERHLFPVWHKLIIECQPRIIVGEQVASADGLVWWDQVQNYLEDALYAAVSTDICGAGFAGDHIRSRQYWFAYSRRQRVQGLCEARSISALRQGWKDSAMDMQSLLRSPYSPGCNYPQPLISSTDIATTNRIEQLRAYGNSLDLPTSVEYLIALNKTLIEAA